MKKILIITLCLLMAYQCMSQQDSIKNFLLIENIPKQSCIENTINGIIIIDKKLPLDLSGYISYQDSLREEQHVNFRYSLGLFLFDKDDKNILQAMLDTHKIEVHLNFLENNKKLTPINYHYFTSLTIDFLLRGQFIFSITNFNKKKGVYYFDWVNNSIWHKLFAWEKNYGNRKKAYKKVKSVFFPMYIPYNGKVKEQYP